MDIARLSMAMSSVNTRNELSMRIMKMALEQSKDVEKLLAGLGEEILTDAVKGVSLDPDVGQLLDILI